MEPGNMDHGGELARPTTVGSTDHGMAAAVQGGEASMSTGTFHGQLGAAAARRASIDGFQPSAAAYPNSAEFSRHVRAASGGAVPVAVFHHQPGPGEAYANIGEFWRQPGQLDVVLVGPQLPDGVVPVNVDYGYSALQLRPGAGRGVVVVDLLHGGAGAVYNGDYALLPRQGAGLSEVLVDLLPDGAGVVYSNYMWQPSPAARHGEVFVALLPDGAGHGEAFVGQLPGGGGVAYDDYGYFALQPRPTAGHGEALVDLLPDGAGHGEVFVDLLPGGGVTVHDDYGYYPWQPRPGAGRGEVFIGPLPDGVGAVFDGSGNFARQTLPALGTGRADGIAGALRNLNLGGGAGYDGSGALADDLGAIHNNPGMVAEHLRRLLPFAGIGACSVAVNGLAAGPGSPAVALHLFVLLLGGLFLVLLHVLRV